MKEIARRVWNEPAVFIGLLATLVLLVIQVLQNDHWSFDHIIAVLAPLLSALGIRQFVTPTAALDAATAPPKEGTTYRAGEQQ